MAISYGGLFALMEQKGIKKVDLRKQYGFNPHTVDSLTKNKSVTVDTIMNLCKLLDCQPGDILAYIPDENDVAVSAELGKTRLTYADFKLLQNPERAEIIDGILFESAPPTAKRQEITKAIVEQFSIFLEGKAPKVLSSARIYQWNENSRFPKVHLPEDISTTVVPDIIIARGEAGLGHDKYHIGEIVMVVEVLSPDTQRLDRMDKMKLYEREKIKEYWIVDPDAKTVQVYLLENDSYQIAEVYTAQSVAKVNILPGCFIELSAVFIKK